ncbi:hypothetical protein BO79DRAFT_228991 [Aspergillus costaricaensis CBS 115574]|uniref:Uncharacterized protein n=1 Tax=Aspergillus costaricaensis CBS 115574 TaxID=1448317 RepID=A0ACD1ID95_9EURO|nr:hypothetical protein BO79DRAFT_228991 [Aspergillus costaricaensis CBS 115574]RAK88457.1 hypothetical protein BO79DRAFT_228991 [Aspergillus costaricaensis CBS 115574]
MVEVVGTGGVQRQRSVTRGIKVNTEENRGQRILIETQHVDSSGITVVPERKGKMSLPPAPTSSHSRPELCDSPSMVPILKLLWVKQSVTCQSSGAYAIPSGLWNGPGHVVSGSLPLVVSVVRSLVAGPYIIASRNDWDREHGSYLWL